MNKLQNHRNHTELSIIRAEYNTSDTIDMLSAWKQKTYSIQQLEHYVSYPVIETYMEYVMQRNNEARVQNLIKFIPQGIEILGWCPVGWVSHTSLVEGASSVLVGHSSIDGVTIKILYGVDVLL